MFLHKAVNCFLFLRSETSGLASKISEHETIIRSVLRERAFSNKAFRVSHLVGEEMRMQGGIGKG